MKLQWLGVVAVALGLAGVGVGAGFAADEAATQPAATQAVVEVGGVGVPVTHEARAEVAGLPAAPVMPESVADLKLIQARVEAVVKEAVPATVAIILNEAQGSGVIVSKDGYVLTAGHVSGTPGTNVRVRMADGRVLRAKTLGANNGIDSGMVKITDPLYKGDFPFVPVGTAKKLTAGQWLVAIGHPGGYQTGRPPVVRLGRVRLANSKFITTDNPLISGDSGGPVFDLDGKLVGINSRIGATTDANIHVPIDTFVETWDRLAKGDVWGDRFSFGEAPKPTTSLGVNVRQEDEGVVVHRVHPGTAAEKGGLKEGDVIVRFNGRRVKDYDTLGAWISQRRVGDSVTLEVLREGRDVEINLRLGSAVR